MKQLWWLCPLLLSGCVVPGSRYTVESLVQAEAAGVVGKTFHVEVAKTPTFLYYTSGDGALITLGGIFGVMAAEGNAEDRGAALAAAIGLADPSEALAERVAANLVEQYGSVEGESELVLKVETESWQLRGDRVFLKTNVSLGINGADKPLASTRCKYLNGTDEKRPSEEVLLADDGAVLKRIFDDAIATCARHVREEMF